MAQTQSSFMVQDPADHIKVSSFYEIDPSKLPSKSPHHLVKCIRIVMVNEKTRMRVSLRYPSLHSLTAFFDESNYGGKSDVNFKKLPALDERYIIGSEVAAEALYRRIPPHELTEKRNSWRFWSSSPRSVVVSKEGSLWSELKGKGMVKWGKRRHVKFLTHHEESNECGAIVPCNVTRESKKERVEESSDDNEEGEEEESDEEGDVRKNGKRKCREIMNITQIIKRPKREVKNQVAICKQKRKNKERYKQAEVNMLKIMKEQGAVIERPILRPALRAHARRLIGDTGLLDHLLKHMSGKIAPGGEERFRRRHNADGAMEYWLENADMVDIRKEAGIQDPYWIPPPGWKPGDNPTRDPICAKEINELKEEMNKIKKNIEELVSKKQDQEQAVETTPFYAVASTNIEQDYFLIPLKEMYIDLVNKKAKLEEQLLEISQSLTGMEEEMGKLKTQVEESNRTEIQASFGVSSDSKLSTEMKEQSPSQNRKVMILGESSKKAHCHGGGENLHIRKPPKLVEDKAAKIQRLKGGFRICKPQGTFLWPNTTFPSSQFMVQLEEYHAIRTPPSVSSTSATQALVLSSVKPLPDKRLVTVPQSKTVAKLVPSTPEIFHTQHENSSTNNSAFSTVTGLNLNESPNDQKDNNFFQGQTSSYPVTYHRRQQTSTATSTEQWLSTRTQVMSQSNEELKEIAKLNEKQQRGYSDSGGTWLALAASNPSSDDKSKRG
ncbi:hypothetical protein K2173_027512 [Erythroxylum novogranatense]|uniref:PTC1-like winged helix-turn-helix domain-containing protein n=1 Tax=Erythroxylum novogranatense TaxID=1862640 RepID=A0AAV8U2S5_9ROSI|nr:hypothetical protein K2173_027512 [Erythroxylum novogranatense]